MITRNLMYVMSALEYIRVHYEYIMSTLWALISYEGSHVCLRVTYEYSWCTHDVLLMYSWCTLMHSDVLITYIRLRLVTYDYACVAWATFVMYSDVLIMYACSDYELSASKYVMSTFWVRSDYDVRTSDYGRNFGVHYEYGHIWSRTQKHSEHGRRVLWVHHDYDRASWVLNRASWLRWNGLIWIDADWSAYCCLIGMYTDFILLIEVCLFIRFLFAVVLIRHSC